MAYENICKDPVAQNEADVPTALRGWLREKMLKGVMCNELSLWMNLIEFLCSLIWVKITGTQTAMSSPQSSKGEFPRLGPSGSGTINKLVAEWS